VYSIYPGRGFLFLVHLPGDYFCGSAKCSSKTHGLKNKQDFNLNGSDLFGALYRYFMLQTALLFVYLCLISEYYLCLIA
jgi:hypothetical protein